MPDRGLAKERGHYYIAPVLEQLHYWGTNEGDDRKLVAAHVIRKLIKIIERGQITDPPPGRLVCCACGPLVDGRHTGVMCRLVAWLTFTRGAR